MISEITYPVYQLIALPTNQKNSSYLKFFVNQESAHHDLIDLSIRNFTVIHDRKNCNIDQNPGLIAIYLEQSKSHYLVKINGYFVNPKEIARLWSCLPAQQQLLNFLQGIQNQLVIDKIVHYIFQFSYPFLIEELLKEIIDLNLCSSSIFESFVHFCLSDQIKADIAKYAAKEMAYETLDQIHIFNLNENDLIQTLSLCIDSYGAQLIIHLQSFSFKNRLSLIHLIRQCVEKDLETTLKSLPAFSLSDDEIYEISKLCTQKNSRLFAQQVGNLKITNQEHLIDLFEKCFQAIDEDIGLYICNFNFTSEETRIQLAYQSVSQAYGLARNIKNFNISDQQALKKIYVQALLAAPKNHELYEYFDVFNIQNYPLLIDFRQMDSEMKKAVLQECFSSIPSFFQGTNPDFVAKSLLILDIDSDFRQANDQHQLLKAVADLRSPQLQWKIFKYVVNLPKNYFFNCNIELINNREVRNQLVCERKLLRLMLSCFVDHQELTLEHVLPFYQGCWKTFIWKNNSLANFLNLLIHLDQHQKLTLPQKQIVLKKLIETTTRKTERIPIHQEIAALSILLSFDSPEIILHSNDWQASIVQVFYSLIPVSPSMNIIDSYKKHFPLERLSISTLLNYATSLRHVLDKEESIAIVNKLAEFISSVYDFTFIARRYALESSLHLNQIHQMNSSLINQWKENSVLTIDEITAKDTDDYLDLLLCGTEVNRSCQSLNRDINYSKGILGYVLDGKTRLLTIKNDDGTIRSRAVYKLLLTDSQPVILYEKIYSSHTHPDMIKNDEKILLKLAKQKAEKLRLPLVSAQMQFSNQHNKFPELVYSLSNPFYYEYSDAIGFLCPNGIYQIEDCYEIAF